MYGLPQDEATDRYHDRLKEHHKKSSTPQQHKLPSIRKPAQSTVRVTAWTVFYPLEREDKASCPMGYNEPLG